MNSKKFDYLCQKIYQTTMNIQEMLKIIEVAGNSIKREKYCKQHNLTYTQFMEAYKQAKGEFLDQPVYFCCMELIISESFLGKGKYKKLVKKVVSHFRELYKKSEKIQSKADEMEAMLKSLKEDKSEKKETPPVLPDDKV